MGGRWEGVGRALGGRWRVVRGGPGSLIYRQIKSLHCSGYLLVHLYFIDDYYFCRWMIIIFVGGGVVIVLGKLPSFIRWLTSPYRRVTFPRNLHSVDNICTYIVSISIQFDRVFSILWDSLDVSYYQIINTYSMLLLNMIEDSTQLNCKGNFLVAWWQGNLFEDFLPVHF